MQNQNEFKGYSLFNDIEDFDLRNRNRAVILANIMEDNLTAKKKVTGKGSTLILGYFMNVPEVDRKTVRDRFAKAITERGFVR
jgi:hypothetical protein